MIRGVAEVSRAELEADESPNRISAVQAAGIDTIGGAVPGSVATDVGRAVSVRGARRGRFLW